MLVSMARALPGRRGEVRMPRKLRERIISSRTASAPGSRRLQVPTMAAFTRHVPYCPLSLSAATPWQYSTSPNGEAAGGPKERWKEPAWT